VFLKGVVKPKGAEFLHMDEIDEEEGLPEQTVTTQIGMGMLTLACGGMVYSVVSKAPALWSAPLPRKLKVTTMINFMARTSVKMGFTGVAAALTFIAGDKVKISLAMCLCFLFGFGFIVFLFIICFMYSCLLLLARARRTSTITLVRTHLRPLL
jgi:hypothetical protein